MRASITARIALPLVGIAGQERYEIQAMKRKTKAKASMAIGSGAKAPTATRAKVTIGITSRGSAVRRTRKGRLTRSID